jgi:hypothetical protein
MMPLTLLFVGITKGRLCLGLALVTMVDCSESWMLVENGNIKPGMTAGAAWDKYPMFKDYSYNCFQSALNNV